MNSQQSAISPAVSGINNQQYRINGKDFVPKTDFTHLELEWIDIVYLKLQVNKSKNEVGGSFTKEEVKKTIFMLLGEDFTEEDWLKMTEGQDVVVIADFFLQKAVLGLIIKSCSMN